MMMYATPLLRLAYTRPIMAGLAVGMVLLLADRALSAPIPNSIQAFEKEAKTCASAIHRHERAKAIPHGLLQAISLAESGRWFKNAQGVSDASEGAIIAWPWTVTTGGEGHFLPNRADAVAFVKSLQADGVENIDVGCMQINLKYHPEAFASIEQAFDVHTNVAYAANFLKTRHATAKSWVQAAGDYHSTTPQLNQAYRLKVRKLWNLTSKADFLTARVSHASTISTGQRSQIAQPDIALTQRFNKAFKIRRSTGTGFNAGQEIANRINALKPGANLAQPTGQSREETFAQRRQAQLAQWRSTTTN
jgi:hypothetical protein